MTFMTAVLRNLDIQDFGDWIYFERLMQELGLTRHPSRSLFRGQLTVLKRVF